MASRDASGADGPSSPAESPPLRRRQSMDEDLLYHKIVTAQGRRPSNPPPYDSDSHPDQSPRSRTTLQHAVSDASAHVVEPREQLPPYSSTIAIEGVFNMKHEIENTTKRAEDRQWHNVFVSLQGTALNIYNVKKDRGWGRSRDGPSISPDNPPWVRKGKLQKSYGLLYADAGIAADYKKRRYVIRIRAETDQFLLSCVELTTFVKWLESLFSAIAIAAPLDSRDFPSDMSVPRILRVRWINGHAISSDVTRHLEAAEASTAQQDDEEHEPALGPVSPAQGTNPGSVSSEQDTQLGLERALGRELDQGLREELGPTGTPQPTGSAIAPLRMETARRLSTSSYPNEEVDQLSGKWFPEHRWSTAHDLIYAKLCYNNLYFRSPRKSKYIIRNGKEWFVDWTTGRMVRVLPPTYGEIDDYVGAWQFVHMENSRI